MRIEAIWYERHMCLSSTSDDQCSFLQGLSAAASNLLSTSSDGSRTWCCSKNSGQIAHMISEQAQLVWTNLSHEERMVTAAAGFTRSQCVHPKARRKLTRLLPQRLQCQDGPTSPLCLGSYPSMPWWPFLPCKFLELSSDPLHFVPFSATRCYHRKMGR